MLAFVLAAITVTASFEGGSIGRVEQAGPTQLRCAVAGQSDQNGRNRQASWYYFRLDNLPREEVRIDLVDLAGEYNFRPGAHPVNRNTRPVYSYDDRTWVHFDDKSVEWDEKELRLTLRLTPERPRLWIAHVPPYTGRDLERTLAKYARHPHLKRETAGRSVRGRDLILLTIADPAGPASRKVVWLMARQHAWEAGTSWVAEGALRFLLSDEPEAVAARRAAIWKIFPLSDPDGVAAGAVRFNALGYDLNRNWDTADPRLTPEIWSQRKAILDWVDGGGRIDLFLALHNTESADYVEGSLGAGGPAMRELAQRFTRFLRETTSFHDPRSPRDGSPPDPPRKGRLTVDQGLFADRKIPAFLMELMVERHPKLGRPRTTEDNLRFGEGLVKCLAAAVR